MITPVENGSTCSGRQPSRRGERGAGRARAREPVGAGAGVGVAGVDQQRADLAARRQVLAAQLHRRGAEAVRGEDAGDRSAGLERDDREVAPVRPCGPRPWRCPAKRPGPDPTMRASGTARLTAMRDASECAILPSVCMLCQPQRMRRSVNET